MTRYLVTILGKDYDAMVDLITKHKIDILRQTTKKLDEQGGYKVDAIVDNKQIKKLTEEGYIIDIREDIEKNWKVIQAQVGKGNRYLRS